MAVSASKLASARAEFARKEAALTGAKPNPVKKSRGKAKSKKVRAKTQTRKANPVKRASTPRKKATTRKPASKKTSKRARTKRTPMSSAQIIQQNRAAGGIPALPITGHISPRSMQTSLFTERNPMEIIDEASSGDGLAAARAKVEASRMARKAAVKKSSKRKSARKSSKKKSARKATAAGRAKTASKVASKRGKKSTKRKTSKAAAPRKASKRASPRKASKRKSSRATSRARASMGGRRPSKTVITQTYLANPQIEAKDIAAFGGGLIGGILVADIVDRFVATRAPEGKTNSLYGTDAMVAIHQKVGDDPIRLLATGGGAALSGLGAWALRDRMPTAAYGFAGMAAGFGMKVLGQLLSDYVVPYLFKSEAADDWSSRLFPDYQEAPAPVSNDTKGPRFGYTYGPYGQMGAPRPFSTGPAVGNQGAVGFGAGRSVYPYGANQRLAQAMGSIRSRDLSKIFPRAGAKPACPDCGVMPPNGRGCMVCGTNPQPVAPGAVPPMPMPVQPVQPRVPAVPTPAVPTPAVPTPAVPTPVVVQPDSPAFEGPRFQVQPQDSIARRITMKEAESRQFVIPTGRNGDGQGGVRAPASEANDGGSSATVAVMRMARKPVAKKQRGHRR